MYLLCWSVKGGSGTTTVAAALAVASARTGPTTLIDLGGDAPAALGRDTPVGPGVGDWWASPFAPDDALWHLGDHVTAGLRLVHTGDLPPVLTDLHHERLAAAAGRADHRVVIDAGRLVPPPVLHQCADQSILVLRPCYLAIRRLVGRPHLASAAVIVRDEGRALGRRDVVAALGVDRVIEVMADAAVARAVDSGTFATRVPGSLARALTPLLGPTVVRR